MANVPIAFQVPRLEDAEHSALKALYAGEATAYQQRLALQIIINKLSRAQDLPYIPGSFDETAFLNGRAFVGQQLLKYFNLPVGKLKEDNNNG